MKPRFELVMAHDYTSGAATDRSPFGNHGHRITDPDPAGGGGLSSFDGRSTRVVVFPSSSLADLGGLLVRARLRLDRLGDRRTVVEGYLAFALMVEPDATLAASIYTGHEWNGLQTSPGAMPLNRWVEIEFGYDGRDTAWLSLDDRLVAARYLPLGRAAGVAWPYGLNVGAWPDRDLRVFDGEIASVSVWRLAG